LKVIFVVDKPGSALHIAAKERMREMLGSVICASDFISPSYLLKYLFDQEPDLVVFSWRKVLLDIYAFPRNQIILLPLRKRVVFYFIVPDYLGLEELNSKSERTTILLADGYFVTNEDLLKKYSKTYPDHSPMGILHDLPNTQLLDLVYKNNCRRRNNPPTIIWVGNSKWGKRQGKLDHKGLESVVLPLAELCRSHNQCMRIIVIDSSKNYLRPENLFLKILSSEILIQTSLSEGTGLPLLEALALGTNVLSTEVGVAKEIFFEDQSMHLTLPDVNVIHQRLHDLLQSPDEETLLRVRYLNYVRMAQEEAIPLKRESNVSVPIALGYPKRFWIKIRWIYQFMKKDLLS
jgi:glycosyltransferase involved in cell wall biosynthesis